MDSADGETRATTDDSGQRRCAELLRIQTEILTRGSFTNLVLEGVPGGVVIVSTAGEILQANEEACQVLGLTRDELANRWVADFKTETFYETGLPCPADEYPVSRCLGTGKQQPPLTLGIRREDHDMTWAVYRATPLVGKDGALLGAVVTFLDVTARKRAEQALRRSEQHLRVVLETTPDHILTVDERGRIIYANRVPPELKLEEVVGASAYSYTPQESHAFLREALAAAFAGRPTRYEVMTTFGRSYVSRVAPLEPDQDGRRRALVIATDVTDQRAAAEERERLESRVQETQRLESLALLAGGVAHDFNNLLVGVLGRLELSLRDVDPEAPLHAHLRGAHSAAVRATELTSQLLAYSGKGKFVVERLDLNSLILGMDSLLGASPTKKLELTLELAEGLPGVEGDATQLRQVVMNLVTNAIEATLSGSDGLVLRTAAATREQIEDARFPPEDPGDRLFVAIEVVDQGEGIDETLLSKVFDPFFSTKFTGRGLGLAAALGIARSHHGGIDVSSTPGVGSTFSLLLPALSSPVPAPPAPTAAEAREALAGAGTVLIVEDEHHVRLVASILLEESGFTVFLASDGLEGIEVFRRHQDQIDVVLLDLLMPNMDGEATLEALREIAPDVRVVLTSGYGKEVATRSLDTDALAGFIKKPYKLDALLETIRRALETQGG